MHRILVTVALLLTASVAFADAKVEEKTQVHFGGAMGSVINAFGRSATHEGMTTLKALHGDRLLSRSGDSGTIIDLREEKVYRVDYARKTYSVVTFDELRKQWEEAQERGRRRESRTEKSEGGPEYEVDFDVRSTGKKETINGFNTHEEIVTVTVHEKGKKIESSGGFILTDDMWLGPRVAAMREIADFNRRYVAKVYGGVGGADMQAMAMALAQTPAFAKAMKTFSSNEGRLEGTPIRSLMTFESVAGKDQKAQSSEESGGGSMIGGLMNKMKSRRQESLETPGRSTMFDSTTELLSANTSSAASDVAIPAGFTKR